MDGDSENCSLKPLIHVNTGSITSDREISIKDKIRECFKPRYQPRTMKNKGALLVLIWSFLVSAMYFYTSHLASKIHHSVTLLNIMQIFMGLTIPLAGWLADIKFGRYKVIRFSIGIMWISSLLLTASLIILQHWEVAQGFDKIQLIFLIPLAMGFCGFQVNSIQFGVDQLCDASSSEISTYVIWYSWTYITSISAVGTATLYIGGNYKILASLLISLNLTLAVSLGILFHNVLIKEPVTQNPFKTVYGVIKYALKHKSPRLRSAFTYTGEEDLPSRIDFGKNKYGGPFTTEQVEDVKTLFRVLLVTLLACALYGFTIEERSIKTNLRNVLINAISRSPKFIFSNFYSIIAPCLIPLHEIFIHPIFNRCLPRFKSYEKFLVGIAIRFVRYITLLILITYLRQHNEHLDNTSHSNNVTLPCILQENFNLLDYRWTIVLEIVLAVSDSFVLVGSLEFFCAQVPYSMKGLVAGIIYSFIGIFMVLSQEIVLVFKMKSLEWGTGTLSCGFWYLLTVLIFLSIVIAVIVVVMRWYKKRKREDVLPNEQIFAERYYSRNM